MSQITSSGRKSLKAKALTAVNKAFVKCVLRTAYVWVTEWVMESEKVWVHVCQRGAFVCRCKQWHQDRSLPGEAVLACLHSFSLSKKETAAFMATVLCHLTGLCSSKNNVKSMHSFAFPCTGTMFWWIWLHVCKSTICAHTLQIWQGNRKRRSLFHPDSKKTNKTKPKKESQRMVSPTALLNLQNKPSIKQNLEKTEGVIQRWWVCVCAY